MGAGDLDEIWVLVVEEHVKQREVSSEDEVRGHILGFRSEGAFEFSVGDHRSLV